MKTFLLNQTEKSPASVKIRKEVDYKGHKWIIHRSPTYDNQPRLPDHARYFASEYTTGFGASIGYPGTINQAVFKLKEKLDYIAQDKIDSAVKSHKRINK